MRLGRGRCQRKASAVTVGGRGVESGGQPPQSRCVAFWMQNINHPTSYDHPLAGFKIVVNPGSGGGGFIATQVLAPLGADVSGEALRPPASCAVPVMWLGGCS